MYRGTVEIKRALVEGLFIWRRGWDDTRHLHVPRPSGSLRLCTSAVLPMCRTHFDVGSESHHGQIKRPSVRAFFIWRRGWDDTRHLHVPRPSGSLRLCTSAVLPMCRTHFDVGSESHHGQIKRPSVRAFFIWRRGWDSNPRRDAMPSTDFESVPL